MMRIGFSSPVEYLAGEEHRLHESLYGAPGAFLARCREWGVAAIELRRVDERTPPEAVLRAARQVWDAGMELTIHARLPEAPGEGFAGFFPALTSVAPALRERGDTVVSVHAFAGSDEAELVARTRASLGRAVEVTEGLPIRFAMELSRGRGRTDPSTTYEGVVGLVEGFDPARVGICWDFGHAWSGVRRGLLADVPPPAFVERVVHTHVHDIGPDGNTHWPLTQGVVPVERCVEVLCAAGYGGVLNLELSEERFAGALDVVEGMRASVDRLRRRDSGAGPC